MDHDIKAQGSESFLTVIGKSALINTLSFDTNDTTFLLIFLCIVLWYKNNKIIHRQFNFKLFYFNFKPFILSSLTIVQMVLVVTVLYNGHTFRLIKTI